PASIQLHRHSPMPVLISAMLPPPPTSTLFPYTTLFRSNRRAGDRRGRHHDQHDLPELCEDAARRPADRRSGAHPGHPRVRGDLRDRKSTRLNSSHVKISYAVFCLKKKKGIPCFSILAYA